MLPCLCLHPLLLTAQSPATADERKPPHIPWDWEDADTGHHVVRLTLEKNSRGLETRANAFTPDGKQMVYLSDYGMHVLDLDTRYSKIVVPHRIESLAVAPKTRRVFFTKGTDIYLYVVDLDTGAVTKVGDLPLFSDILSVNADETLLVGKSYDENGKNYQGFLVEATRQLIQEQKNDPTVKIDDDIIKERAMKMRVEAKVPSTLFTVNLATGQVTTILNTTDWIGYAQFSPTDPTLIMYAKEGMYYSTDRIWTIRSDGSENTLIHKRTEKEESATREFWSKDGKTIWYEWQKPRGKDYALVAYDVATGKRRLYQLEKDEASIFYNVAPGDAFLVGSGHRAVSAKEGSNKGGKQSIEILYPVSITTRIKQDPQFDDIVKGSEAMVGTYPNASLTGWFRRVTVANMFKNDYTKLEPNIRVSPDGQRIIFTSNMLGPTYIFAVDIAGN
jgi:oligogalacturonide lyase